MLRHQQLADDETEDGIAEEFELFVVVEDALEIFFVDPGFVGQGALQQLTVLKGMTQHPFESLQLHAHRCQSYFLASPYFLISTWPGGGAGGVGGLVPPAAFSFIFKASAFRGAATEFTAPGAFGTAAAFANQAM